MTFDPNIPLPGDFLSDSQGDIKNNFTSSNNSFGRNHTNFSVVTNAGKHKFVELLNTNPIGVAPVPPLILGEGTLYTKSNAVPESQLFYSPDASGNEIQMTRVLSSQFATFGMNVNNYTPQAGGGAVGTDYDAGWTFLPGQSSGLVLIYGRYSPSGSTPKTGIIKFPITVIDVFSIQLTLISKSGGTSDSATLSYQRATANTKQFSYNLDSAAGNYRGFYWQVIASAS